MVWLSGLTSRDLEEIASALESSRIGFPVRSMGLERLLAGSSAAVATEELNRLANLGFHEAQAAVFLRALAKERVARPEIHDLVEIVTSGPEVAEIVNRDTGVVVRELFSHATHSVLVAGYAVYQGKRVFQALAERMEQNPSLQVRLFLDIQRGQETSLASELALRFAARFQNQEWPAGKPLPQVFFDPRSLEEGDRAKRACLHAKVVVVDEESVFLSSANFTEAAQERNIELGFLLRSELIAARIRRFFDVLLQTGQLERVL